MSRSRPCHGSLGRGELASSLVFIVPLFLAYEVGVLFSPSVNGVDFVTRHVYAALDHDRGRYLLFHLALAIAFGVYLLVLRRRRQLGFDSYLAMVLESTIYAITLGSAIVFLMQELLGFQLTLAVNVDSLSLGDSGRAIVTSLGAGVHEELVFRLGLMGGGHALLRRTAIASGPALVIALIGSAVLFSAAHHVGPHGDAWDASVFTYRALAGVAFGLIFYYRSLAHAVYTHVLYDLYVLLIR